MRSAIVGFGIVVVVFATACGKQEEVKVPLLPVPVCKVAGEYDAKAFGRLAHAMDRSGDIAQVTKRFLQHRMDIEALLTKRDPATFALLKPVLDAEFSDERLRTSTACAFLKMAGDSSGVAALDAWSRDPKMKAISTAIWSRTPVLSKEEEDEEMTPERKAMLGDIAAAMALRQAQTNTDKVAREGAVALVAAFDPQAAPPSNPAAGPGAAPNLAAVVDDWLTPVLRKVPDDDLADYLKFAGSRFGSDYYVALSAAYDFQAGEWYAHLVEKFKESRPPTAQADGQPAKEALVLEARRLLHDVGGGAAAADALAKLLQAEPMDPRNPEIHALIGEATIMTAPAMPLPPDQLRVVIDTPNYEQADMRLAKALELAPDYADALMMQGRLRYLQGKDAEAAALYERVRAIEPEHPRMDCYLGDLAFAQVEYAKAVRHYQTALSKPEGIALTHHTALTNLVPALRKISRMAEYPRIAEGYIARHPEAWNFRFDYAEYLLANDNRADKVLGVIEPVPDAWLPTRKFPIVSAALMRKASENVGKTGEPLATSMQALRRVMQMNPDPRTLAEAVCRSGVSGKLAQITADATPDPKATSTALVVCALRWRRTDVLRILASHAHASQLNLPHPDLGGDTPLCYAVAIKDVKAFIVFAKIQLNPLQKCRDGNTVPERLQRMAYGGDQAVLQMQNMMLRFYKRS